MTTTTDKPRPPKAPTRGRAAIHDILDEVVSFELQLEQAHKAAKMADAAAERARDAAYNASAKERRIRAQLVARIRVFRQLAQADGLDEATAARFAHMARFDAGIEQARNRPSMAQTIAEALPYAARLEQLVDGETQAGEPA
jgi:hypothetical protein